MRNIIKYKFIISNFSARLIVEENIFRRSNGKTGTTKRLSLVSTRGHTIKRILSQISTL